MHYVVPSKCNKFINNTKPVICFKYECIKYDIYMLRYHLSNVISSYCFKLLTTSDIYLSYICTIQCTLNLNDKDPKVKQII